MDPAPGYRAGFVAVVGRPNVGKSTLINAVVGKKISIVSPKPQTTRHRITAIHTMPDCQIAFVDTPGLHRKSDRAMNRLMNRTAVAVLMDADLALFVTEAGRWNEEDDDVLTRIRESRVPAIAVLNKMDRVQPRERLLEMIDGMSRRYDFVEIVPLSATRGTNLDRLVERIAHYLPESPPLFPDDVLTDRSTAFRAGELIREKLTLLLRDELPYGVTVQIERVEQDPKGATVHATIWVERDSQKGIVVGKGGGMLRRVGRAARIELRKMMGCPVHLELWVKVKENWADSIKDLQALGFESS